MNRRTFIKRGSLFITGVSAFGIFVPKLIRAQSYQQLLTQPKASSSFSPITSGLVGWYKMAEGTGTTSTADSSGNGNTMLMETSSGNPTWVSSNPGSQVSSYALSFASANSQYLQANDISGWGSASFGSVTCWIKSTANQSSAAGIGNTRVTGNPFGLSISNTGTNILTGAWSGGSNEYAASTGLAITNGTWQFAAMTASATNLIVYLNSSYYTITETNIAGNQGGGGGGWNISNDYGFTRYFNGAVADFRIYNRTLSPTEISTIYNLLG